MFNPKVSIIIPVYNWSNYLSEAINSAISQTYDNCEVIVVNDGSVDNNATELIALSYEDKIKYFSKKNGGVSSALNFGIEKSTGEYISWLSHDDLYYPNKIEEQVSMLEWLEFKDDKIIFNDFELIDEENKIITLIKSPTKKYDIFFNLISQNFVFNWCTLLIPKGAFLEIWLFDNNLKTTQDYNMWLRFIKWGYEFIHLPMSLTQYRIHPNQDSINKKELCFKEIKEAQQYVLSHFTPQEIQEKSWSNKNKFILNIYLRLIFLGKNILWYTSILSQKIGIYALIAPLYRKYFIK